MSKVNDLITFWEDVLTFQGYLLEPSITYQIEQTIKCLEQLNEILKKGD